MNLWVLGADGMVGTALIRSCQNRGIPVVGTSKMQVDITQLPSLFACADQILPTHIVNCAAYTHVDRAEIEREAVFRSNVEGALNVAKVAKSHRARLIHLSTDYVFDGMCNTPYLEDACCAPVNYYGWSKREGEQVIVQEYPSACIIRTSWVFGPRGKNLLSTLWHRFQAVEEMQIVSDQWGKPTYSVDLAEAILHLLDFEGIIHFANATESSYYTMACALLSLAKEKKIEVRCKRLLPVTTDAFKRVAQRPMYSVLDTSLYEKWTSRQPRSLEAIFSCLDVF